MQFLNRTVLIKNIYSAVFFVLLMPNLLLASETQFRIELVKDIRLGGYSSNPHKLIDASPDFFLTTLIQDVSYGKSNVYQVKKHPFYIFFLE